MALAKNLQTGKTCASPCDYIAGFALAATSMTREFTHSACSSMIRRAVQVYSCHLKRTKRSRFFFLPSASNTLVYLHTTISIYSDEHNDQIKDINNDQHV